MDDGGVAPQCRTVVDSSQNPFVPTHDVTGETRLAHSNLDCISSWNLYMAREIDVGS